MAKKRTYKRKPTKRRRNSRKNKVVKQSLKFLGGDEVPNKVPHELWGLYQVTGIDPNGQRILSLSPMTISNNRNDFNEYETNEGFVIKKL